MAVTELLGAEDCKIPKMETSTSVRDGTDGSVSTQAPTEA